MIILKKLPSEKKILLSALISFLLFVFTYYDKNSPPSKTITISNKNSIKPTEFLSISISPSNELFLVTKVIDGDTIEIVTGEKVRYIGIDTPEKNSDCYAQEATHKNIELVFNKKIQLKKDVSEKDKYGRLLRYVYVDNIFVNEILVKDGFAQAATYPPDVSYSEWFKKLENKAREEKKGLWDDKNCN